MVSLIFEPSVEIPNVRAGLTIGELQKIIDLVTDILKSVGHQRIAYPSDEHSKADVSRQAQLRVVSQRGGSETESSS
jgi:hypothetical protein